MERNEKAVKRYPSDDKKVVTLSVDPSVYAHMKELCRLSNMIGCKEIQKLKSF